MGVILIRRVEADAIATLQALARQTFFESFADQNSDEDMSTYLEERLSIIQLQKELADTDSVFYFASNGSHELGYLKVNFGNAQSEFKEVVGMEIERIYVLQEYQGNGIGLQLLEKAIELGRGRRLEYVWLGVWEYNRNAIRFYEKNGFIAFDKHVFRLGKDEQTDVLMKREL